MSPARLSIDKFRAEYRKLLEQIMHLAGSMSDAPNDWASSLVKAPLLFPPELDDLPQFAKLKAKFLKLVSAAPADAGVRDTARNDVVEVLHLAFAGPAPEGADAVAEESVSPPQSSSRLGSAARASSIRVPLEAPAGTPAPDSGGGLLGVEPSQPSAPAPSPVRAAAGPAEPRFLNAEIAGHTNNEPLDVGATYVLEFGVDVKQSGHASARIADADVLFAENEQMIELTVQVVSDDFDVAQGPTPLRLPRTGPSKGKARFDITPKKAGRGTLTATIHKGGNFLMQMEMSYSIGTAAGEPATAVAHGRTIAAAGSLQPRELGLAIRPASGGGYECTVWGAVSTRVTLPITEAALADAIAATRKALMDVITQRDETARFVFQTGLDIDAASQEKALRTLARAGASLFQRIFFGPDSGPDVQRVGEWLRTRATQPGERLKLQIVAERFPIPWGMLYVGKVAGDTRLDWDLFLGLRHIIEQIPLQTNLGVDDNVIKSDNPSLAVSVNVNTGIDTQMKADFVARQLRFWNDHAAAFGARMQIAERRSRADLLAALTSATADHLMYLYCHAITSNPGDDGGINASCLVLSGDERLTLGDLNLEAPTTEPFSSHPLIFVNACESAELTPAFYDGFVPYFMAKGARGVIGTECKTPALFATEWALRFFPRFLAGEPLGELFLDLRREFATEHRNPLGLLYAVYCDGDTKIQPGLEN